MANNKKKRKMRDLLDIYLSQFIAGLSPSDFEKILRDEHEFLEVKESTGIAILKIKKDADIDSPLYDFYKTKNGLKLDCIEKYYYRDNFKDDSRDEKNAGDFINSSRCFLCRQMLLDFYDIVPNNVGHCKDCHNRALSLYRDSFLKLKSQRNKLNGNEE